MAGNHSCNKVVEITELRTQYTQTCKEIKEIKESLKWTNRYILGILISVILTLVGGWFK